MCLGRSDKDFPSTSSVEAFNRGLAHYHHHLLLNTTSDEGLLDTSTESGDSRLLDISADSLMVPRCSGLDTSFDRDSITGSSSEHHESSSHTSSGQFYTLMLVLHSNYALCIYYVGIAYFSLKGTVQ